MMTFVKRSAALTLAAGLFFSSYAQNATVPKGWHLEDKTTDGYYGISLDKAYDFVKGRQSKPIVVAIIDSGIDTLHEDLKTVLWTNTKEIPGNGIDDDNNGYVDDVHGWNFLGGRDGRNVKEDSYEAARFYHKYKSKFDNADTTALNDSDQALYKSWKKAQNDVVGSVDKNEVFFLKKMYPNLKSGDSVIVKDLNKTEYTGKDLEAYTPSSKAAAMTKNIIMSISKANNSMDITNTQLLEELEGQIRKAESADAPPKDYRGEIVQDNYDDINDRFYGNNDIMANTPMHGTHVAGIIAAARNNGKGMNGIADNAKVMMVRAVPDGDEHDKDIALAIRYAVDNGAKVINMSFGKSFSPEKPWVDSAVAYAASKGVLLVHAAGNDAANVDSVNNFPNPTFVTNNQRATNWITVGASSDPKMGDLVSDFSNYGKKEVDVFAPGSQIYSTLPGGNTYGNLSGTSMASPVVAGLAAFVWSYFPNLTLEQLRDVIENSASKITATVKNPHTGEMVPLSELSVTGGLVNAYEAVKLASTLSGKSTQPVKSKSVVKKTKRA